MRSAGGSRLDAPSRPQESVGGGRLKGGGVPKPPERPYRGVMNGGGVAGQLRRGGAHGLLDIDMTDRPGARGDERAAGKAGEQAAQEGRDGQPMAVHNLFITRSRPGTSRDMMGTC